LTVAIALIQKFEDGDSTLFIGLEMSQQGETSRRRCHAYPTELTVLSRFTAYAMGDPEMPDPGIELPSIGLKPAQDNLSKFLALFAYARASDY
jgi:hypothetical protein